MLVEAQELTRYYGGFCAVDHASFSVERGEIVGLLGPNGAGKTTTIRMLTGFLPTSEGTARIAGHDVRDEPTEVRRHIGYMPENNPLYPEMRVGEYLSFRAQLKGVPRRLRRRRTDECIALCGVGDVAAQIIGTLSKGYRQRVGLADAMLGRPDVLILDEPTIGLDPNQVRETRRLIRSLSEEHTVLISTHILAEAEAICRRVLIIDRGRIVADDTPRALSDKTLRSAVIVELRGDAEEMASVLRNLEGVERVELIEANAWNRFSLFTAPQADVREAVFLAAAERGWPLRELTRSRASLEDVFHRITLGEQEQPDGPREQE
ncbi:MAG: ABC transporter ATP-binding protein [Planctomycetota bacterium]